MAKNIKSIRRGRKITIFILICFLAGLGILVFKVTTQSQFYMSHSNEQNLGKIYDRNENVIYDPNATAQKYGKDYFLDVGNLVGDDSGQMTNTLLDNNRKDLVNYSFLTGSIKDGKAAIYTSLFHDINKKVYAALGSKNGTVIAYNYKTGEIYVCFSKPSVNILEGYDNVDSLPSGSLLCKAFYGTIPGSTQKISTVAAALEYMGYDNLMQEEFTCSGTYTNKNGDVIKCHKSTGHGTENVVEAFENSCNAWFAQLVADKENFPLSAIEKTYKQMGYSVNGSKKTKYSINGINCFKASTVLKDSDDFNTQWGAMGQGKTLVSPCQSMMWQSAIANKSGQMTMPYFIEYSTNVFGQVKNRAKIDYSSKIFTSKTASELYDIMTENGTNNYSSIGHSVGVKSGTAQVDENDTENSLLSGFCTEKDLPVAFCICIEDRKSGEVSTSQIAKILLDSIAAKVE